MIRATTGRPMRNARNTEETNVRPSSANAKLQSRAYRDLTEERKHLTTAVSHSTSSVPSKPHGDSIKDEPHLERRLTLGTVDGIGKNALALTRLNNPVGSMKKIKIEERITLDQLHKIKSAFEEADTDGSGTLDIEEFKVVVKTCLNVKGRNEEQIVALFMKIDSSSDGEIDWDEFCTYMQLEYAEKEDALQRSKQVLFHLPTLSTSTPHNKAPILRVICNADSSYMCAGQDGLFSFWSNNLKLRKAKSILDSTNTERPSFTMKPSVWVTDVALLVDQGKLLVGTGERELHFYELITFEIYCQIIGLDAVPLRIDLCQPDGDQCLIVYGDDQGCVSIMMFNDIGDTLRSWKKVPKVNGVPTVTIYDVSNGDDSSFVKWKVHEDWITEIRYFHELRSVISSSNHPATALVRGCTTASTALDQLRVSVTPRNASGVSSHLHHIGNRQQDRSKKYGSLLAQRRQKSDQSVFYVYKGVKTFDFCTTTNIVATGGVDRIVRLWNPYVPHKPTGLLRGHASPIVFISIAGQDKRIFSISADKCIKVWDLLEQNCLVTLNPKLHKVTGEIITCSYSHHCRELAIVSTDRLSLLKLVHRANLAEELSVTHSAGVTCCAYNSSFGHVITCSDDSVIKLWDFETGHFMFEFNKVHGDSAITSLTFDSSGRRLITSGRDGAVRIWNYNNGHCLRSLERENDSSEVTDCVYAEINKNRYIIAVGWDHRINIFPDETDEFHHIQRPYPHWPDDLRRGHKEDIVSVAFGKPSTLATVSYDGLIIAWNIISGHSVSRILFPSHCLIKPTNSDDESDEPYPDKSCTGQQVVNKLIILSNRLPYKNQADLIAGCSDGTVIFWSIHQRKAYARFHVSKRPGGLSCMAITKDEAELYIGTHIGYLTSWEIDGYALKPLTPLSESQANPKETPPPPRLAEWRCHVQPITSIEYVEDHDIVLTSSTDYSVRMWTTTGQFIGTFGQSASWDVYDRSTWQHPMVPPEVLLDPQSMPDHPILDQRRTWIEVVHSESLEPSDSEEEEENRSVVLPSKATNVGAGGRKQSQKRSQSNRKSSSSWLGGSSSSDNWRKKLSRRLSRSALMTNISLYKEDELNMLDEVRKSMCKSAGKRLRHEKLVAQQRLLRSSRDPCAHAYQTLKYFELGTAPEDVSKPSPRNLIDDVFLIQEEDEDVSA